MYIEEQELEHVSEFVLLSSAIPSSSVDVKRWIALASAASERFRASFWRKSSICNALKARLYNALSLPIATYTAETWTFRAKDTRKL